MRNRKKRWKGSFLTAALAAVLAIQPLSVSAAGGSYTKEGIFHIDQFGEYDIVADVTVTEGKISNLDITGENFAAQDEWKREVNKGKLQSAAKGMKDTDKPRSKEFGFVIFMEHTRDNTVNGREKAV